MMLSVTDLTAHYTELIVKQNRPDDYQKIYPALFRHYFAHWGERERPFVRLDGEQLGGRMRMLRKRLMALEERFTAFGLYLDHLPVVFFVGQGTANGHAFLDNGRPVVWIAVETIETELAADVFMAHEMIHGLHYGGRPEFALDGDPTCHSVARRVITEGLATLLTQKLLGLDDISAIWADILGSGEAAEWLTQCRRHDGRIREMIAERFDQSEADWGPLLMRDRTDIFNNRCGYYIALKVMQEIAAVRAGDPIGLLNLPRSGFEKLFRGHLQEGYRAPIRAGRGGAEPDEE